MKTIVAATAFAVALGTLVPAAQAQPGHTGFYGTLCYANASFDHLNLGAVQGRLGYRMARWFGVEGDVLLGVGKDSRIIDGDRFDFKLKHAETLYAVAFL